MYISNINLSKANSGVIAVNKGESITLDYALSYWGNPNNGSYVYTTSMVDIDVTTYNTSPTTGTITIRPNKEGTFLFTVHAVSESRTSQTVTVVSLPVKGTDETKTVEPKPLPEVHTPKEDVVEGVWEEVDILEVWKPEEGRATETTEPALPSVQGKDSEEVNKNNETKRT